ncbi:MAG: phospho-N-acetylmuramoyl-pentapeptide-transferase [Lachnospiraceae bacterium]|jgi:phospho-N-acetylmuramoyl-pentapeptide-transferase|nr:phospho-N-acetylmuramoyl-pentapeptide-transferase [Lachnospiraceae bacterium]MCI6666101.1 phospho-N-acetylmuramoyl-pentapeptide-transferase [Lachnospiraceae bacterium]MDO4509978.1 phospho-N-acetylmuramoyl-pentapeptide-transferase [Lachnospiraceae bacterium]MDY3255115.1 phospho-N-acetylmuramoyl-pentapeptide-transferase [Lachnospiraceae bacterium]
MIQNLDKSVYISLFLSFILTTAIAPIFIPFLLKLKVGQTVRDDGPESHLKKNGTPTMGGIIILIGFIGGSVIFCSRYSNTIPIMLMTIGFGLIGFIDDYIKVVLKRSMGLRAWQKLLLQIIVTAIFAVYLTKVSGVNLLLRVPFTNGYMLDLSWFSYVILFIAVLGTVNGANLTDGVDGLASSVTIVIAIYFAIIAVLENMGLEPTSLALIGSLLGFLVFNCYPAKVFMGDTGSLALGGYVIATAYMLNMPLYVIIVAVIYLVENISVMLQVSYFKITKGKRLFKMAPIHHHFEKSGWSETKVVTVFTIVSIFAAVIGYLGY